MIVVSDTSVILNLCCVGHPDLLEKLFGEILAPSEVLEEFTRLAETDPRFLDLEFPEFIRIADADTPFPTSPRESGLHSGELAALALALQRRAEAILMDEKAGRSVAEKLNIPAIGVIGILLQAKNDGHIRAVAPILDLLSAKAGFWLSSQLRSRILSSSGED